MTSIDVIENRISSVKKYLKYVERYRKYSQSELENSIDLKGAFERYLYLVCQSSIDLAEAVISYRRYRKPSSMHESFEILHEEEIISFDLMQNLVAMAGFRNVITHGYDKLDFGKMYAILQDDLKDVRMFLDVIIENFHL